MFHYGGGYGVATVKDLIEDWIQMRSTLQSQLKALESGIITTGDVAIASTTEASKTHVKKCIEELNSLLKEYAGADQR
jgi:hypothetical protein